MSRFSVLKQSTSPAAVPAQPEHPPKSDGTSKPARQDRAGKIMVGGHFSAELSRAVKVMAAEQGTTVQALIGQAIDLLMREHGKHPFGER